MDDGESLKRTRWECKYHASVRDSRSVEDRVWAVARAPQTDVWLLGVQLGGQVR